jgi:hypothetical protein
MPLAYLALPLAATSRRSGGGPILLVLVPLPPTRWAPDPLALTPTLALSTPAPALASTEPCRLAVRSPYRQDDGDVNLCISYSLFILLTPHSQRARCHLARRCTAPSTRYPGW